MELLVVIVVIGILASITIVAYNNIQQRARNSLRVNAVSQLQKVVKMAASANTMTSMRDSLNVSSGWYRACLGTGYADSDGDGVGDCGVYGTPYVSESDNFTTMLSTWATVPSMGSYPVLALDGNVVSGPFIQSAWVDGRDMLVVEYALEGSEQDCQLGPLVYYGASDTRTMTPSSTPKYSLSEAGTSVTECMIAVYQ